MLNKKKKGQRKELLCQKELEKEGWKVLFKSVTVKRGPCFVGLDFADLFDIVAVKLNIWKFISVKHFNGGYYLDHQKEIKSFEFLHGSDDMEFCLWLWHKPKWCGRGKNKKWVEAHWEIIVV